MEYGYSRIKVLEKTDTNISIKTEGQNPKEFFVTRDGLYVYGDFNERILEKALVVDAGTEYNLSSWNLVQSSPDAVIESALPEGSIFRESDVCAIIADLISKQPKGEEGILQNNGYANLFYTPSFVVDVSWHGSYWDVDAWKRDGIEWSGGGRVFSPAVS